VYCVISDYSTAPRRGKLPQTIFPKEDPDMIVFRRREKVIWYCFHPKDMGQILVCYRSSHD
jgi:hypothetical protein